MAELKTKPTAASVADFLAALPDARRREECRLIAKLMEKATGAKPQMWGPSIVGFGTHRCVYASGRTLDWFELGFSPRKQALTLYLMGCNTFRSDLMPRLGPHKTGKCCLYLKRLEPIDLQVLEQLIDESLCLLRQAGEAKRAPQPAKKQASQKDRPGQAARKKAAPRRKTVRKQDR